MLVKNICRRNPTELIGKLLFITILYELCQSFYNNFIHLMIRIKYVENITSFDVISFIIVGVWLLGWVHVEDAFKQI